MTISFQIKSIENNLVDVLFYGDNTTARLSKRNIQPFDTVIRIRSKQNILTKAIEAAQKDFDSTLICQPHPDSESPKSQIKEESGSVHNVVEKNDIEQLKELRTEFEKALNVEIVACDQIL